MSTNNTIYLPGLNAIRAIAAINVLLGHVFITFGNWGLTPVEIHLPTAPVTTFFVISGFLITYLLMHEMEKTNNVSITKFYVRRILRIWPLYYGYMAVVVLAYWLLKHWMTDAEGGGLEQFAGNAKWFYCFFTANLPFAASAGILPIVHYWSLGVEEQYYAWYPWVVKYGKNHLLSILFCIAVVWFLSKLTIYAFIGKVYAYRLLSATQFDHMMLGAIGAILYYRKTTWFCRIFRRRWINICLWGLFLFSGWYTDYIPAPVRNTYMALISLGVIMTGLIDHPWLENKVMNYLGQISYGIYVIHPLLILVGSHYLELHPLSWPLWLQYLVIYMVITLLTIIIASLSYEYFEKPFLSLKKKFMVVNSTNSK